MKKNRDFLLLISLLLIDPILFAQYDPSKINKKAVQLYSQAMQRIEEDNLALAAGLLQKSIELDKNYVDAYLSLAGIYGQKKNYKNCIEYYEKAFVLDTNYTIEFKLPYSINLAAMGRFQNALDAINEFLAKKPPKNSTSLKAAEYRKRCFTFGVEYAKTHPDTSYVFAPKNLGDSVNSRNSEYFPSLTIDGSRLVITRNTGNEDFYYCLKNKDGSWTQARPMEGDINTVWNEGAQNISQDGQWLVFTGCNWPQGFGGCDLYISYLTPTGWSKAENLGGRVNTDVWDAQPCLSPDKKDLYFASSRPGGYGGKDIYVCHLLPSGRWSEPENLGPTINTSGDEQCPFMHADNQTLYFTSNFWPGYGDDDLFYSKKLPGGKWTEPVNLGYPINTIYKDGTLFIAADGKTAYYASEKSDSRGGLDIYSFELREDIRPDRTLWVKGKVMDKNTTKGLPSTVELIDLKSKQTISKVQSDESGNYLVTLPVGKDYAFNVNRKGYLFYSDNFLLSKNAPDSTYEKNIYLQPIEVNATIVLHNIFFDVNKYDLKPESQTELDKLVQLLNENPTLRIEISGHTDDTGKPTDNLVLSNNRAKAVVNYLISKGIPAQRLTYKGYGESQPVADNKTEPGRALNRRTEMKVIGQ
jgi:outer membrane protein OmpA-like peptidoglycan-associated protein/tetratricopeptide (TPR) repeat protein